MGSWSDGSQEQSRELKTGQDKTRTIQDNHKRSQKNTSKKEKKKGRGKGKKTKKVTNAKESDNTRQDKTREPPPSPLI